MTANEILSFATAADALKVLSGWIRAERQRLRWTQAELARRSGVPATTISRLERTGLASTDSVFAILFALNKLDAAVGELKEHLRLAELPMTLREDLPSKPVLRVRVRKART